MARRDHPGTPMDAPAKVHPSEGPPNGGDGPSGCAGSLLRGLDGPLRGAVPHTRRLGRPAAADPRAAPQGRANSPPNPNPSHGSRLTLRSRPLRASLRSVSPCSDSAGTAKPRPPYPTSERDRSRSSHRASLARTAGSLPSTYPQPAPALSEYTSAPRWRASAIARFSVGTDTPNRSHRSDADTGPSAAAATTSRESRRLFMPLVYQLSIHFRKPTAHGNIEACTGGGSSLDDSNAPTSYSRTRRAKVAP